MAKTKGSGGPHYVLDDGVGVCWETNKHGWGLDRVPAVAVMHHPLKGMTFHGPFVDENAAHLWIVKNGRSESLQYYGDTDRAEWFVVSVNVPTHPKGEE